eukprot:3372255-Prymnesium_polylepis.1
MAAKGSFGSAGKPAVGAGASSPKSRSLASCAGAAAAAVPIRGRGTPDGAPSEILGGVVAGCVGASLMLHANLRLLSSAGTSICDVHASAPWPSSSS